MKLEYFMEKQVRGYLLSDIRSLQMFRLPPRTHTGWLGYPLLMTVVAGIELLGTLGCDEEHELSLKRGEVYFTWYWQRWLYSDPRRKALAAIVYQLLRHGIAHTFVGKPCVDVTRFQASSHLRRQHGSLVVDADALADDFTASFVGFSGRLRTDKAYRSRVEHRLETFEANLVIQSRRHCKAIAKAEPVVAPTVASTQNATIVSSPSIASALVLSTRGYGASW